MGEGKTTQKAPVPPMKVRYSKKGSKGKIWTLGYHSDVVKWERGQHMEEGWGKIPKTKNVRYPLEVMFCLMSVNLELLLTCNCFQGVSVGLSARRYNHRLLTLERGFKGLIQFQTAHFENQWLSNLSMH